MQPDKKRFIAGLSEMHPLLAETIQSGGTFRMITAGTSMLPLLRDRKDTVILKKAKFPLNKFDIPLYIRPDGHFVLHRIMKVDNGSDTTVYTMCGDNQLYLENNVSEESVIAVVDHIIRNNKLIKMDSFLYKTYVFFWCRCYFIRFCVLKFRSLCKKVSKKILKK